jgi:2-polyprenyl-3-methyl-5-hydroxy-6-metoxy-1,4-benzoquinol methylase
MRRGLLRRLRGDRQPVDPRRAELEAARAQVIEQHGEWLAHNIHVGSGVHTRGDDIYGDEFKVRRAVRLVEDLVRRPWSELRIADLGCNEGLYACEFTLRGASVLGVEGRESNLAKARFAKESLGLDRLELLQADVRTLSRESHGAFDVVVCWGLLYHLDTPGLFTFVEQLRDICDGVVIADTQVSLSDDDVKAFDAEMFWADPNALGPIEARAHGARTYWGRSVVEHPPESTLEQRMLAGWASLDNPDSFWLTKPSLVNLFADSGFATVLEAQAPRLAYPPDRVTLAALGRGGVELQAAPAVNAMGEQPIDERPPRVRSASS